MIRLPKIRALARALAATGLAFAALAAASARAATITISDSSFSGDQEICPRDNGSPLTPVAVNAFSVVSDADAAVARVQVRILPAGAYAALERVEVRSGDAGMTTSYGSMIPTGDSFWLNLATPLPVTTTPAVFKLAIVQRQHEDMPPPSTGIAAAVKVQLEQALSFGNTVTGMDVSSSTVVVDNGSPANVVWEGISVSTVAGVGTAKLDWAGTPNPTVLVLRREIGPVEDVPTEGVKTYSAGAFPSGTSLIRFAAAGPEFPDAGLTDGRPYYYRVFTRDACGNYSTGTNLGPIFPGGSGEGDLTPNSTKPVVGIVNPGNGPATRPFKVQVRVFSPNGAAITEVRVYGNNGSGETEMGRSTGTAPAVTKNTNYDGGTANPASGIYEFTATTANLADGTWTLRAWAANVPGPAIPNASGVYSGGVGLIVGANKGDGKLLVRDNSSQLCADCHKAKAHSSEATGMGLGSWYVGCRTCHDPHGTTNAKLIAKEITPPSVNGAQAPQPVFYTGAAGNQVGGKANPSGTGLCQVCHTRTDFYRRGVAAQTHGDGAACSSCHSHTEGQKASCSSCHGDPLRTPAAGVAGTDALLSAAPPSTPTTAAPIVAAGGVHFQHVNKNTLRADALPCSTCHLNYAHADQDVDLGWGPLAVGSGTKTLIPFPAAGATTAAWTAAPSCINYCHGGSLTDGFAASKVAVAWGTPTSLNCGSCHGNPPDLSPHYAGMVSCEGCHPPVPSATHIDGVVQAQGCTGCHGGTKAVVAAGASQGEVDAMPPSDATAARNNASTFVGVGAHVQHANSDTSLAPPLACNDCHLWSAFPSNADHKDGASPMQTALGWNSTDKSCSISACHGAARPVWTDQTDTFKACNSCHGTPPAITTNHPQNGTCGSCHPGFTASAVLVTGRPTHVNGAPNANTTGGCARCHGALGTDGVAADSINAAPGVASNVDSRGNPATATNVAGVGAHRGHLTPRWSNQVACVQCHPTTAYTNSAHANGAAAVPVTGTIARAVLPGDAAPSPLANYGTTTAGTCTSVYCHGEFTGGSQRNETWAASTIAPMTCTSCHGNPPLTAPGGRAHPNNSNCGSTSCHGSGYSNADVVGLAVGTHINGQVDYAALSCTSCHGDAAGTVHASVPGADANQRAAPPNDSTGLPSGPQVGQHLAHVNTVDATNPPYACLECHTGQMPGSNLHADGSTTILAANFGTIAKTGGVSPSMSGSNCSNTYCHGNFQGGKNAIASWTGGALGCDACHGNPPIPAAAAAGVQVSYHPNNIACQTCHPAAYTRTGLTTGTVDPATHVRGTPTLQANRTGCVACHGTPGLVANEPASADPNVAGAPSTDAHVAHVNPATATKVKGPIHCTECHGADKTDKTHADNNSAPVWGTLANGTILSGANTNPSYSGGSCTSTYCHGARVAGGGLKNPLWTSGAAARGCGACHGNPPLAVFGTTRVHPNRSDCSTADCHGAGYGATVVTATTHIDGKIDVSVTLSCTSCHGSATLHPSILNADARQTAAPPLDSTGAASGGTQIGAHVTHVNKAGATNPPYACVECHTGQVPVVNLHADGSTTLTAANFGTIAKTGLLSPSMSGSTCSNTYCHGNFEGGKNAIPSWTGVAVACDSCHGNPPVPAAAVGSVPASYHPNNTACQTCHPTAYTRTGLTTGTVDAATHVRGSTTLQANRTGCVACHGTPGLVANDTTNSDPQVAAGPASGAHAAHVNPPTASKMKGPLHCTECHGPDKANKTHADNNSLPLWSASVLATTATPASYTQASGNCSNYCHGATLADGGGTFGGTATKVTASWNSTLTGCATCHGLPPNTSGHTGFTKDSAPACNGCHDATVNASGGIIFAADGTTKHINGQVEGGESSGGQLCTNCHSTIYTSMASGGLHRHSMTGATTAPGPSGASSPIAGYPTATTAATCVQCHVDHNLFRTDINPSGSRAKNLRASVTAQPTAASTANTDHNAGTGVCVSCHASSLTKAAGLPDAGQTTPVINGTSYTASSHDYGASNPTSTFKDGSTFAANCTKCHSSEPKNAAKQTSVNKFALHSSTVSSLTDPLGVATQAVLDEALCFRCHSKTTDAIGGTKKTASGRDYWNAVNMSASSEDVYTAMQKGTAGSSGGTLTQAWTTLYFKPNSDVAASTTGTLPTGHLLADATLAGGTWVARAMTPGPSAVPYETQTATATTVISTATQYWRRVSFISPPAEAATTMAAGPWTLNVYGYSNSTSTNFKVRYAIYTLAASGTLKSTILPRTSGTANFGTASAVQTIATANGASVAIASGDRVVVDLEAQSTNGSTTNRVLAYTFGQGADASVTMPTGITLTATVSPSSSSARHDVAKYSGVHKVDPAAETRAYIAANKHVACADCHSPHGARQGSPGTNGTATAVGTTTTLTDGSKNGVWTAGQWVGFYVQLVPPTATARAGQSALITASTAAGQLTFAPAFTAAPASGDTYVIYARTNGGNASAANAAGTTGLTDSSKNATWTLNMFANWYVFIQSGAGAGQVRQITANTAAGVLTVTPAWTTGIDTTSVYRIVKNPQDELTAATGVGVTTWVATTTWTGLATNTYNPSTTTAALITNTGAQWQVCFKCHSGANANIESTTAGTGWSAGLAANSTFTDIGREFSPQNGSYHPIVQALPATDPGTNGSNRLLATQLTNGWKPGALMTCSDCHNNDASAPAAQGPHGSAIKYMLAGVNKAWPFTTAGATSGTAFTIATSETGIGTNHGLFCRNCHPNTSASGATNNFHTHSDVIGGQHGGNAIMSCVRCHIRVPHGGKVSRLILTQGAPARYQTSGHTPNFVRFLKATSGSAYNASTPETHFGSTCSAHSSDGSGTGNEAW